MRKVSVPLMQFSDRREEILLRLNELGAQRVFLCTDRGIAGKEKQKEQLARLTDGVEYFKSKGYEVGIWLDSIGHGVQLTGVDTLKATAGFTKIKGITGESADDSFCPLDEGFASALCGWVAELAGTGASMIMFDDDYRLANRPGGFGCLCDKHMKLLSAEVGEELDPEELLKLAFCGGANKYRSAFLKIMGDTLYSLAKKLRAAVDAVSPEIRMGFCACLSSWDSDGVDCFELTKIFAGKNEPFLRLIGAPYWPRLASFGGMTNRLGYIIELERMQAHWCEGRLRDVMSEGDVYPRPRHFTPSAYLEGYDTALIADGRLGGILKYAVDYCSSPSYETGYTKRAAKNRELYSRIERIFSDKEDAGVAVACEIHKLHSKAFPDEVKSVPFYGEYSFIQQEQEFLCGNSIPIKYGKGGVCACFGQNAATLDINDYDGFIIDLPAARLLQARGIDAGLISCEKLENCRIEYFPCDNEQLALTCSDGLYGAVISEQAQALSYYDRAGKNPSSYYYESPDSVGFYVICADMDGARSNYSLRRSYERQKQLLDIIPRLSGKKLPAVCPGNPDLYILCKASGDSLSVGLWNFFEDYIPCPCIELDGEYSQIEFINCSGSLEGDRVRLDRDLHAFEFVFFEVKK